MNTMKLHGYKNLCFLSKYNCCSHLRITSVVNNVPVYNVPANIAHVYIFCAVNKTSIYLFVIRLASIKTQRMELADSQRRGWYSLGIEQYDKLLF